VTPGLDIVVCNYRTAADLHDFLNSLVDATPQRDWNLTVVNVAPHDNDFTIGEWATDVLCAQHLSFADNIGYGRACNAGALKGRHELLAFFNADVTLNVSALEDCCRALEQNPEWGVLGPRQVDEQGYLTHAGIFGTDARPAHRAWKQPDGGHYGDVKEAVTVSGAAYFTRRGLWNELANCQFFRKVAPDAEGAFLPTRHYWNETYTSYHARAHGWKVMYYGPVCIVHKWHRASPVGGRVDQNVEDDRQFFRLACELHGMEHD
jgi:GT2 family glycosyltransferase